MPDRLPAPRRPDVQPLPVLHLELWVTLRKNRARVTSLLRAAYGIARRLTQDGGGRGPWVFLVDPDPPDPKTARLRKTLALRTDEDLWVEFVFYPSRVRARGIILGVWRDPQFAVQAAALDALISRRRPAHQGILAYGRLKPV